MKPEQLKVAATYIEGRDMFSVLSTGFGKSLCYACLPLTFGKFRGYSLVVVLCRITLTIVQACTRKYITQSTVSPQHYQMGTNPGIGLIPDLPPIREGRATPNYNPTSSV